MVLKLGAEYEELGERIGAKPVGSVDRHACHLAGSKQSRQRSGAVFVGVDAAHDVVDDGADGDELVDRVYAGVVLG